MKKFVITALIAIVVIGTSVYATQQKGEIQQKCTSAKPHGSQYNICLLLDLSDRIDPRKDPLQAEKDRKVIAAVTEEFAEIVKRGLYVNSRDTLRVAVAPQPTDYRKTLLDLGDTLAIDMRSLKVAEKRQKLPELKERFIAQSGMLYDAAVKNREFTGGDIWSFFRDNLESYRVEGSEAKPARNILVVLTDGYLNFASTSGRPSEGSRTSWMEVSRLRHNGWEEEFDARDCGLIPAGKAHGNWEVLVLEVDPKSPQDLPVIRKYWSKWFDEMGISHYRVEKENDSAVLTREVIATFIKESAHPEKVSMAKR